MDELMLDTDRFGYAGFSYSCKFTKQGHFTEEHEGWGV